MDQIHIGIKPVMFGEFYRPPGYPESHLLELRSSLFTIPKISSVFLCGDFNLLQTCWDDLCVSSDKFSSVLYSMINDLSLEQCVSTPTRGSNILDLAFTNSIIS